MKDNQEEKPVIISNVIWPVDPGEEGICIGCEMKQKDEKIHF